MNIIRLPPIHEVLHYIALVKASSHHFGICIWLVPYLNKVLYDLLFFNVESTNNVICSRPKQQTFKCRLYKNGELIGEQ